MYTRFCEANRCKLDVMSSSTISVGVLEKTSFGYKVICQMAAVMRTNTFVIDPVFIVFNGFRLRSLRADPYLCGYCRHYACRRNG